MVKSEYQWVIPLYPTSGISRSDSLLYPMPIKTSVEFKIIQYVRDTDILYVNKDLYTYLKSISHKLINECFECLGIQRFGKDVCVVIFRTDV